MATVVEILVKLIPVKGSTGPEQQDAVEFRYTGLNQAGKEALLNRAGDLNLRVVKSDVILRFVIDDDAISWGGGSTWKASLPTTGGDALWIFDNVLDKSRMRSRQGVRCSHPPIASGRRGDGLEQEAAYLRLRPGGGLTPLAEEVGHRPRRSADQERRPQHHGDLDRSAAGAGLLLGLTSLLLAANLVVQIFGFGR